MALGAVDVLVTGVAYLIPLLAILFSVRVEHIRGMRQVVTYAVIAKSLTMALITLLLLSLRNVLVGNRPAEISMSIRYGSDNDRCFN